MKEKEFIRWQKYRKIGQLKFTLLWSLYFIVMINIVIFVVYTIKGKFTFEIGDFLIRVIIGGLSGIFSGTMMWKSNEKDYVEHLKKI
ncbi:hypothetical protein UT300007_27680 [Clostridium sp. CTA-7]